jgi:hypothetical protein
MSGLSSDYKGLMNRKKENDNSFNEKREDEGDDDTVCSV